MSTRRSHKAQAWGQTLSFSPGFRTIVPLRMLQNTSILFLYRFIDPPDPGGSSTVGDHIVAGSGGQGLSRSDRPNRLRSVFALGAVAWLAITLWDLCTRRAAQVRTAAGRDISCMSAAGARWQDGFAFSSMSNLVDNTARVVGGSHRHQSFAAFELIHRAYVEESSGSDGFFGRSFDIVTAASAVVLALALARIPGAAVGVDADLERARDRAARSTSW